MIIAIAMFSRGVTLIAVPNPRDQKFIISCMKKYKPDIVGNVPTVFLELMKQPEFRALDFSKIQYFASGAAPFPGENIKEFEKIIGGPKLVEVYGLTETSPIITALPRYGAKKPGSAGIPFPDTEIKSRRRQLTPCATDGSAQVISQRWMKKGISSLLID